MRAVVEGWIRFVVEHTAVPEPRDETHKDCYAARPDAGWAGLLEWAHKHKGEGDDDLMFLTNDVEWWLPGNFASIFRATDPAGNKRWMGSARGLLFDLESLNKRSWKADQATLKEWWRDGRGDPVQHAFAVTHGLAQVACVDNLPMILDY